MCARVEINYAFAAWAAWRFIMAKAKKIKEAKAPREVRRNIPAIDNTFLIFTIVFSLLVCILMTYVCSWSLYVMDTEDKVVTFQGMMKYIQKTSNLNFMISYIFCSVVFWGAIGFVLSQVIIKFAKHLLNYR